VKHQHKARVIMSRGSNIESDIPGKHICSGSCKHTQYASKQAKVACERQPTCTGGTLLARSPSVVLQPLETDALPAALLL
jgi:hypothetical protein